MVNDFEQGQTYKRINITFEMCSASMGQNTVVCYTSVLIISIQP